MHDVEKMFCKQQSIISEMNNCLIKQVQKDKNKEERRILSKRF